SPGRVPAARPRLTARGAAGTIAATGLTGWTTSGNVGTIAGGRELGQPPASTGPSRSRRRTHETVPAVRVRRFGDRAGGGIVCGRSHRHRREHRPVAPGFG